MGKGKKAFFLLSSMISSIEKVASVESLNHMKFGGFLLGSVSLVLWGWWTQSKVDCMSEELRAKQWSLKTCQLFLCCVHLDYLSSLSQSGELLNHKTSG